MLSRLVHSGRQSRFTRKQVAWSSTFAYSKGCGLFGALGLGEKFLDSKEFARIPLTTGIPIHYASASWGHTALSTARGDVYLIGRPFDFSALMTHNQFRNVNHWLARQVVLTSALMDSKTTIYTSPTLLPQFSNINVKSVHCSAALTAVLTEKGQVYTMGSNRWGQCGIATYQPRTTVEHAMTPLSSLIIYKPSLVRSIPEPIHSMDLGLQHCVALSKNGRVYTWGKCDRGQLGCGPSDQARCETPTRVDSLRDVVMVSAGFNHTAALDAKGQVFVWGKGMSTEKKASKKGERTKTSNCFISNSMNVSDYTASLQLSASQALSCTQTNGRLGS